MTITQIEAELETTIASYVRDPLRRLDLLRDLIKLFARHDLDVRQAFIDRLAKTLAEIEEGERQLVAAEKRLRSVA